MYDFTGSHDPINLLEQARRTISAADRKIVLALAERFAAVRDAAAYKMDHGLPSVDLSRRRQVIEEAVGLAAEHGGNRELTRAVIMLVVTWMEEEQKALREQGTGAFADLLDRRHRPSVPAPEGATS
jgi:chorismate mutase